ncbi:hypothetical protein C8N46_10326 [Kordia periserrulae]|uniref:Lipoprotein n=1 Tax=Kordia periserrulae TaxID=701523 RepID=A0A2T6C0U3_9FLAO|nr:hypothetical protein [Kordia periserrulae]PTX61929.1 hypothetical protein C8N46_10326 [Kordia periserrulae]
MKQLTALLMIFFLVSCENTKKEATNRDITKQITKTVDTTQTHFATTTTWNASTTIGEATVLRTKEVDSIKIWSEIQAVNVFGFKKDVPLGDIVQVIPLSKKLPILGLKVMKTTKRDDFEDDIWYEVDLEAIQNKAYSTFQGPKERSDEYPIDLLVVHPAVKNCTLLENHHFKTSDLPTNITNEIIKGALDFDNDGLPDAIVCEFCCENRTLADECEYFCGETYIKVKGEWILINTSQPA